MGNQSTTKRFSSYGPRPMKRVVSLENALDILNGIVREDDLSHNGLQGRRVDHFSQFILLMFGHSADGHGPLDRFISDTNGRVTHYEIRETWKREAEPEVSEE